MWMELSIELKNYLSKAVKQRILLVSLSQDCPNDEDKPALQAVRWPLDWPVFKIELLEYSVNYRSFNVI